MYTFADQAACDGRAGTFVVFGSRHCTTTFHGESDGNRPNDRGYQESTQYLDYIAQFSSK